MSNKLVQGQDPFEVCRAKLWGIAYRMLGTVVDTEDALQDTFLKWMQADQLYIKNYEAWLVTVCTRRCIDILKAVQRQRLDYVGTWLPEPILDGKVQDGSEITELASTISTAFMLMLERLQPRERAVFLLRQVFEYSYADTARVISVSESTCRQINSRLKKYLPENKVRSVISPHRSEEMLAAFMAGLRSDGPETLEALLHEDVEFWADGGGKAQSPKQVVTGRSSVIDLLRTIWDRVWHEFIFIEKKINGQPGVLILNKTMVVGTLTLQVGIDGTKAIYVVRNPEKLTHLQAK